MARVDALFGKAAQDALAEAVLPHRAHKAGGMAQARHGVDIHRRVAAGERPHERPRQAQRLIQIDAHYFYQHIAQ